MVRRYEKAPERGPYDIENEETYVAERCIRIFERVMDAVNALPADATMHDVELFSPFTPTSSKTSSRGTLSPSRITSTRGTGR